MRATSASWRIEAKRDFWLATVDLKAAVAGGRMSGSKNEGAKPTVDAAGDTGRL
jgi:hypothetical protein